MRSLRFILTSLVLFSAACAFGAGVFQIENVEFQNGTARLGRSGAPIFADRFESSDAWPTIANYRGTLDIEFGKEIDGRRSLFIGRSKPIDPDDSEDQWTAWSITTAPIPIDPNDVGREYVVRAETVGSKRIAGSGSDADEWRGRLWWRDASGEVVDAPSFLYCAECEPSKKVMRGTVPEGAASVEIRMGFDAPGLKPGEYTVLRSVSFELVDDATPYFASGSFVSRIFRGGAFSWDVDAPKGSSVAFQVATASNFADGFSDFVGPDGTADSFYTEPFDVDAPYFRYKVFLLSNGVEAPSLKSTSVDSVVDSNWRVGGDSEPPLVKIVGERAIPNPDRAIPLQIELSDPSLIEPSSLDISLDGEDANDRFDVEVRDDGSLLLTSKYADGFSDGLHCAEIESADALGNRARAIRCFLVGEKSSTPQISMREDGMTLIDGVPFFPIGLFGVSKRDFNGNSYDAAIRQLKEAGFNFAHSYFGGRSDEFLAAVEKYGLKTWVAETIPDERFVDVERWSPAIIAWYLADDTEMHVSPSQLYDYHRSVKAVDPTRLTVQADYIDCDRPITNYRPYVYAIDAFMPEIYPLNGDDPKIDDPCVARVIRDVKRSQADSLEENDGPRSIWPIIQFFKGWWSTRFSTYEELRAMSFAALAADANGITWFFYSGTEEESKVGKLGAAEEPESWELLTKVVKQIEALTPVLCEQTIQEEQPTATVVEGEKKNLLEGDAIVCLLKTVGERKYLIAVNSSTKPCSVRFEFPEKQSFDDLQVMFDEKDSATPTVENGALVETLERYGVRVYSWNAAR